MSNVLREMVEFYTDDETGKEYEVVFYCTSFNYRKPTKGLAETPEDMDGYVDSSWDYTVTSDDSSDIDKIPDSWISDQLGLLEQELIKEMTGQYDQYSDYDDFEEDQLEAWVYQ